MNQRDADRKNANILYALADDKREQLKAIEARIEMNISAQDVQIWGTKWDETHAEMTRYVRAADKFIDHAWFA